MKLSLLKKPRIIFISVLIFIFCLIVIPLIFEGFFSKKLYLKAWDKSYSEKFVDPRIKILSNAILAPNGHNLQNWSFVLSKDDKNSFDIYINSERLSKEVDPLLTQTIISQGTLYGYITESANHYGYKLDTVLFPDGEIYKKAEKEELDSKRIAHITIEKNSSSKSDLYEQIFKPDTSRIAFKKEEVSENILKEFNDLNNNDALSISYIGPNSYKYEKLKSFIKESVDIETKTERVINETSVLFRKNENEKNKYRYGFSFEGSSINPIKKHFLQSLLTLNPGLNDANATISEYKKQTEIAVENNAGFILISTDSDTPKNEFDTGELYGKIVLKAHEYNLSLQPISAPIEEYEEMRELSNNFHYDFANKNEKILLLFRIGEPIGKTQHSMRMDIMSLIK